MVCVCVCVCACVCVCVCVCVSVSNLHNLLKCLDIDKFSGKDFIDDIRTLYWP